MATLRSLLDIYGALDEAVIQSDDPQIAETVDRILPGAAAPANRGWYRELDAFMFPEDATRERGPVSFIDAMNELNTTRESQGLTVPELSRLLYGVGALIQLQNSVPNVSIPRLDDSANQDLMVDIVALAGPKQNSFEENREIVGGSVNEFMGEIVGNFRSWRDWPTITANLSMRGLVDEDVAAVPLCQTSVVPVDGIPSVVVDTEFTSHKVSLKNLKAVVSPLNWDENYPGFFCNLEAKGLRSDGWRKVLETVGICDVPGCRHLRTMLKYYKTEAVLPDRCEARLDYDLNDPVPDPEGDGQITVDRGFINMWSHQPDPDQPGVTVRTRKVAHITGVRPETQRRFVCIFGYANAAIEMMFGPALDPPDTARPWVEDDQNRDSQDTMQAAPSGNSVASTAIKMMASCAEDLTTMNLDLADRWMSGQLTLADLAKYGTDVGARLGGEPWRFMQAISQPKGGAS